MGGVQVDVRRGEFVNCELAASPYRSLARRSHLSSGSPLSVPGAAVSSMPRRLPRPARLHRAGGPSLSSLSCCVRHTTVGAPPFVVFEG